MALSAVVVWAGGFMLLSPTFVGTPSQLLTAFLWGFATDLGITKAFDLAKGLVPATKPVQA